MLELFIVTDYNHNTKEDDTILYHRTTEKGLQKGWPAVFVFKEVYGWSRAEYDAYPATCKYIKLLHPKASSIKVFIDLETWKTEELVK